MTITQFHPLVLIVEPAIFKIGMGHEPWIHTGDLFVFGKLHPSQLYRSPSSVHATIAPSIVVHHKLRSVTCYGGPNPVHRPILLAQPTC